MSRKLKLAFAMGGGVSLGTFSGAAITQSIKLAVLFGSYEKNGTMHRYDAIEIDVLSGASAGALTLVAMLRRLMAPCTDLKQLQDARARIESEFPGALQILSDENQRLAIQAQLLQIEQEHIWSERVNVEELLSLNDKKKRRALTYKASLLDREHIERVAHEVYQRPGCSYVNEKPSLLGDRVLVAMSLTCLSPIVCRSDAVENINVAVGGVTSFSHKETRVFDLHMSDLSLQNIPKIEAPDMWLRMHLGMRLDNTDANKLPGFALANEEAWRHLFSTAIACGAFPVAFAPVGLERYRFEYAKGLLPQIFKDQQTSAVLHYVDGGVFNNEPVREAYRLSAFLDAQDRYQHPDDIIDRRVILIDPSAASDQVNFNLRHLHQYAVPQSPLLKNQIVPNKSIDKVLPAIGDLIGAILNQARSIEENKIKEVEHVFDRRREFKARLIPPYSGGRDAIVGLAAYLKKSLDSARNSSHSPSRQVSLVGELKRVFVEEISEGLIDQNIRHEIDEFYQSENGNADVVLEAIIRKSLFPASWWRLLTIISFDSMMSLSTKDESAVFIAVTPVKREAGKKIPVSLPGRFLFGFSGFFSREPDTYEFRVAWDSAFWFMKDAKLLGDFASQPEPLQDVNWVQYRKDVERSIKPFVYRLVEFLTDLTTDKTSHRIIASVVDMWGDSLLKDELTLDKFYQRDTNLSVQIFLEVPSKEFGVKDTELLKENFGAVEVGGAWLLPLLLKGYSKMNEQFLWRSESVSINNNKIRIEKSGKKFCEVELPSRAMVLETTKYVNPIYRYKVTLLDEDTVISSVKLMPYDDVISLTESLVLS